MVVVISDKTTIDLLFCTEEIVVVISEWS